MFIILISVKKNSIIIVGGTGADYQTINSIEVLSLNSFATSKFQIPHFPKQIDSCFLFLQNGLLMVCGGTNSNGSPNETCFQLKNGSWQTYNDIKTTAQ